MVYVEPFYNYKPHMKDMSDYFISAQAWMYEYYFHWISRLYVLNYTQLTSENALSSKYKVYEVKCQNVFFEYLFMCFLFLLAIRYLASWMSVTAKQSETLFDSLLLLIMIFVS